MASTPRSPPNTRRRLLSERNDPVDLPLHHVHTKECLTDSCMRKAVWFLVIISLVLPFISSRFGFLTDVYTIHGYEIKEYMFKWPATVLFCAFVLLFTIMSLQNTILNPDVLLLLGPTLYFVHQFEEHGVQGLDARHSPFKNFANFHMNKLLGHPKHGVEYLTDVWIICINFFQIFGVSFLAIYRGARNGSGVAMYGITLVNSCVHFATFVIFRFVYNPGILTSTFLLFPASMIYFTLLSQQVLNGTLVSLAKVLGIGILTGVIAHTLIALCVIFVLPYAVLVSSLLMVLCFAEIQFYNLKKSYEVDGYDSGFEMY